MANGFDGVYVDTRRQLRGVADSLNPTHDVDALTSLISDFFERGRREVSKQP
jgi:hypothetical protein